MPRRIHLAPHLTDDELYARYRHACEPAGDHRLPGGQGRSAMRCARWIG